MQQRDFARGDGRRVIHRRQHARHATKDITLSLKREEHVVDRIGARKRFHLRDDETRPIVERLRRPLLLGAVDPPGDARHDPAHALSLDTLRKQPQARIDPGLAGSDDAIVIIRARLHRQVTDRHAVDTGSDAIAPRTL